MKDRGRILIVGAGPTGLGVAWRLQELGYFDYLLLESSSGPGGLASSYLDPSGFTWDLGGHVHFSHYSYYTNVLDRVLAGQWLVHGRQSRIWLKNRFVPYPFQYNLKYLDQEDREVILSELECVCRRDPPAEFDNFKSWILGTFGERLAELFLLPYNFKVWGYPPEQLGVRWMGERVAVPDLERIRGALAGGDDETSWGPNETFRFPASGGTGAIWKAVAANLPRGQIRYGAAVSAVDLRSREVCLTSGERVPYKVLASSMPLDRLCALSEGLEAEHRKAGASLFHSACHIVGIGLKGELPERLGGGGWMYFPESHSPYYRVTLFSSYSPQNVPAEGYWSLMAEICETSHRPVNASSLVEETILAMKRDRLLTNESEIVSTWSRRVEYGYPTPQLNRECILGKVLPRLEKSLVFSRGRFGAWRYEVSNQDHSFMQGVELVNRLFGLGEEHTVNDPDLVNSGAFS